MRVLVTGLGGFTGRYVGPALQAAGHEVCGLDADLTDPRAVAEAVAAARPRAVVHLAGQAFVAHGDVNATYAVNLLGTNTLLTALGTHAPEVERVLLASSAAVYGNRTEGFLDEDTPADPASHYGISKHAMEAAAGLFADLPVTILRPFNYTGVGQDARFVIPKIVAHFRDRAPAIELGNIDVTREFGDVRAVAAIYARLVEVARPGQVLNICTGAPHALREAIDLCTELTGHRIEIRVNPAFLRANEPRRLAGDPARLHAAVGDPPRYGLRQTLAWMLDVRDPA